MGTATKSTRIQTFLVFFGISLFFLTSNLFSQSPGDWQSVATGNWTSNTTWQKESSGSWVAAGSGEYPGSASGNASGIVYLRTGVTVTLDANPANSISNLTIDDGTLTELDVNGNTLTATGNVTINGDIDDGSGGGTLAVGGNFTINNTATWDNSGNGLSLTFNGSSGTQTISGSFSTVLSVYNFTVNATGAIVDNNLGSDFIVSGTFFLQGGTYRAGSHIYSLNNGALNPTVFNKSGGTLTAETSTFKINSSQNARMYIDATTSFYKITHAPTGSKYLRLDETDGGGGSIYYTITNSLEISPYSQGVQFYNQALVNYSGTTTLSYTTGNNITIGNEWPSTNGPTNVTINSSANYTLGSSRTVTGTLTKAGSGKFSIAASSAATLSIGSAGVFALNGGTFDLVDNTNALTLSGRLDMGGGTLTLNSGTLTYNSGSLLRYTAGQTTGDEWGSGLTVYSVTVQSGTVTIAGTAGRTLQDDLTVNSTLNAGANALTVGSTTGDDLIVNGTLNTTDVNVTVGDATTLGASASLNTDGGSGTGGAFSTGGTLDLGSSASISTSGGTVSASGKTTLAGSAQISTAAGSITLQDDVDLGYSSNLITSDSVFVYGDLTISGGATIDNGSNTAGNLVMSGSGATDVSIDGTVNVFKLTVNKTNGSPVTVSTTSGSQLRFFTNGILYVRQGILSLSSTSQILDSGGGSISDDNLTLKIEPNATLKTGGTDITGFAIFTLDDNSIIEFNGSSSEDIPSATLGDVTVSNTYSSGVNLEGNITLQTNSNLTVNSGSRLNLQGYTITHAGTPSDQLDVSGSLYTDGSAITGFNSYSLSGTVVFNGTSAETIPAASFTTMTVNNGAGVTTGGNVTVTGTLNFTNGKVTSTSGNLLTLGVTATASPTATSFVLGPVARQTDASATSFDFPIGNGNSLRDVNLTFTAAPATSQTITVEANGASSSPTSTLDGIKSVEDDGYWTISTTLSTYSAYTATFTTTNFSPGITGSSSVTMIRGSNPIYNTEKGTSPSPAADEVAADFAAYVSGTLFGDFAVGNTRNTFTWDAGGGVDTDWSTAANWVGDAVPQTGDVILFDNSAASNYAVVYDTDVSQTSFYSISVSPSNTVSLTLSKNATLTLTDTSTPLTVGNGGTLIYNGTSVSMNGTGYNASLTSYNSGSTVQYNELVSSNVQADTYYNLTVNLSSSGQANGALTVNNNFTNSGSAAFTAGGSISVGAAFSNTGTMTMPSGQAYTLSVTGTTNNAGTLTLSSTGTVTFGGNVTLASGTLTPNSDTHVQAGLTGNGGTFSSSVGTVIMDGGSSQTIDGSTAITFNNLTLNNSNGLTLSQNPTIEGTLTFTSGLINTGSNYITVGTGGSTSGANASRYVNGRMRKAFSSGQAGSFTFDTGKGGEYLPVSIDFTNVSAAYTVAVEQYNSDPHGISSSIDGTTLSAISIVRYWLIDGTGGTPTSPQVTLTWNSSDGVSNLTALDVAQYNGSQWTSIGGDGSGTSSSGTIQSATMVTGGNYFTFGDDDDNGQDNSLPVTLTSFEAKGDYSKVTLNWLTVSEVGNLGFNIYRSIKGLNNWQKINADLIPGQGNSSSETNYEYIDSDVVSGRTYSYQLESVSINGVAEVLKTVEASIPVPKEYALFNNYPNPFNPATHIKFQLPEYQSVKLAIYDMKGRLVSTLLNNVVYDAGEHVVTWDATDNLGRRVASGMYFYRFSAGSFNKLGKMILLK